MAAVETSPNAELSGWRPGDPRPDRESMLRVDQAGEYGAIRIYAGQLAVMGNRHPASRIVARMAAQEQRHLDRFDAMKPKQLVPSHGPFGGPEIIEGYRTYLTLVRDRAAEFRKAGMSQDEAVQAITQELAAQYPDKNRLAGAIRAGYAEAR